MKEQILSKAVEAGGSLRVKSALNPILWLCAIITIPTLLAGTINPNISPWIIAMGISPVAIALFGFLFLLFFDRDKLQSEEYQLRKRTIELTQQKGDLHPMEVNPKSIVETPDSSTLLNKKEASKDA